MLVFFTLTLLLVLSGIMACGSAASGLLTSKITSVTESCKTGEEITVSYTKGGLDEYTYAYMEFYAVPENGTSNPCILLHEEKITHESSGKYSFRVDKSAGEWVMVRMIFFCERDCLGSGGNRFVRITDGKPLKEFNEVNPGTSGWVKKNGKTYYGNEDGEAVFGLQEIDGKLYYFNDRGELCYGWIQKADREWTCADENGVIIDGDMQGRKEIYVPSNVDYLTLKFFAGAGRDFVIRCDPGSYAESFALKYGFQYDNGIKRVVGYEITSVEEKVKWIVANYVQPGMTDAQIADVLASWLETNAHYDGTYTYHYASGVLLNGYGVCQSYRDAYGLLLDEAGIENTYVNGGLHSDCDGHTWTLLRIDGQWYHCDTTGRDVLQPSDPVCNVDDYWHTPPGRYLDQRMTEKEYHWNTEEMSADENRVGWVTCKGHTYYYDGSPNGGRHIGWLKPDSYNLWYYFDETGTMVTGDIVIDGVAYHFDDWGELTGDQPTMRNGLFYDDDSGWRLFSNGQVASDYTGLYCDANLGWWLVRSGAIDFGYTGLWNDPIYGWWLIGGGQVAMDYTGLWNDPNLGWWLIGGGQICWDYIGLWNDPAYGWWLIDHGALATYYNGLWVDPAVGTWMIQNGTIDWSYAGN